MSRERAMLTIISEITSTLLCLLRAQFVPSEIYCGVFVPGTRVIRHYLDLKAT